MSDIVSYNCSRFSRMAAARRQVPEPNRYLFNLSSDDELLLRDVRWFATERFRKDRLKPGQKYRDLQKQYTAGMVIAGGVELDPAKIRLERLPGVDVGRYARLHRAEPGKPVPGIDPNAPWLRTETGGGGGVPPVPPRPFLPAPFEDPGWDRGGYWAKWARLRGIGRIVLLAGPRDDPREPRYVHSGPERLSGDEPSLTIYRAENGEPERFVHFLNGRALDYSWGKDGGVLVAKRTEEAPGPTEYEILSAAGAVQRNGSAISAWRSLPAKTAILGIEHGPDGDVHVLALKKGVPTLSVVKGGRVLRDEVRGDRAIRDIRSVTRAKAVRFTTRFTTKKLTFAHAALEGEDVVLQVGAAENPVRVPLDELRALERDPKEARVPELDAAFRALAGNGQQLILLRDALASRPERFGGSTRKGEYDDPVRLASLLQERYSDLPVRIDDPSDRVAERLASIKMIQKPEDLGLAIPPTDAQVADRHLLQLVTKQMARAGVKLINRPDDLAGVSNILVVSAHNNAQLFDYLESLGRHRIDGKGALSGKLLLLNTCFDPGNPNMIHEMIERYDLAGVYFQTEIIDSRALQSVLIEVRKIVQEVKGQGKQVAPDRLLGEAVLRVRKDKEVSPEIKREAEKLKRGLLQISHLGREGPGYLS